MSTSINTNISALAAQSSLRKTGLAQASSMERLSTGIRINNAKDDAAGLAISTRMTANIRGISAAIRNANDGISLTQTAEGSLSVIGDNLQRIRELAVQSSNSSNSSSDRLALNSEASQLVAEIDRVASNTAFNGIKLLDGTYQNQALQIGAGNDSNDRISVSIGSAKAASLGVGSGSSFGLTMSAGTSVKAVTLVSGDLSINGVQVAGSAIDGVSSTFASGSGLAKAAAINAVSGQTGVTAAVGSTSWTGVAATTPTNAVAAGSVLINGIDIGAIEASTNAVDRGTQVAAAINAKSNQTGVTASSDSAGVLTLAATDGRNIAVKIANSTAASNTGLAGTGVPSAVTADTITISAVTAATTNTLIYGGLTFTVGSGSASANDLASAFSNLSYGMTAEQATAKLTASGFDTAVKGSFTAGVSVMSSGAASSAAIANVTNFATTINSLPVTVTTAGTGAATITASGATTRVSTSQITLSTTNDGGITLGGAKGLTATGQTAGYNASVSTLGSGVSNINLSTSAGSQAALTVLDKAINTISDSRASMGAYQNRLNAAISNLETTSMNVQASRSRILDTDYAKETTNLAKSQIITQAATAMLAQANQSAQSVLALLK
jgi:flagellin